MKNKKLINTKIRHVGIVVNDLEKSLHFWCEVLGFVVFKRIVEKGSNIDLMMGLKNVEVETAKLCGALRRRCGTCVR